MDTQSRAVYQKVLALSCNGVYPVSMSRTTCPNCNDSFRIPDSADEPDGALAAALRDVAELTEERDELRKKGDALALELDVALRDVAAYKRAKEENDDRFMTERDRARYEVGTLSTDLAALRERLGEARDLVSACRDVLELAGTPTARLDAFLAEGVTPLPPFVRQELILDLLCPYRAQGRACVCPARLDASPQAAPPGEVPACEHRPARRSPCVPCEMLAKMDRRAATPVRGAPLCLVDVGAGPCLLARGHTAACVAAPADGPTCAGPRVCLDGRASSAITPGSPPRTGCFAWCGLDKPLGTNGAWWTDGLAFCSNACFRAGRPLHPAPAVPEPREESMGLAPSHAASPLPAEEKKT